MSHTTNTYPGIDYGLGQSNIDKANGIRYGVISMNSINLDCTDGFENDYGKPHCPNCGREVKESSDPTLFTTGSFTWNGHDEPTEDTDVPEWFDGQDYCCLECKECFWSDSVFPDEAIGWSYERDGYQLTDCLNNDIFVIKSPYYTFAQFCSPCVPGAGNLDTPVSDTDGGAKTYCLGHDWFDSGKAPYPVFQVSDAAEVLSC